MSQKIGIDFGSGFIVACVIWMLLEAIQALAGQYYLTHKEITASYKVCEIYGTTLKDIEVNTVTFDAYCEDGRVFVDVTKIINDGPNK
jgi:hypothetical protein